jgi:DNA helicase-2/ATP-dependent DNA helicase PcrA
MSRQYTLQRARVSTSVQINYASELNAQQLAAVTAPPGPILVIAGAGSGKTRTPTYCVAYLLENGIDRRNVLLLTFTNKAAKEMLGRVANLLPVDASGLWGGLKHFATEPSETLNKRLDITLISGRRRKAFRCACG